LFVFFGFFNACLCAGFFLCPCGQEEINSMSLNLVAVQVAPAAPSKSITYTVYATPASTYGTIAVGDLVDFTASLNPDGSARNPSLLAGAFPARFPVTWSENGGDLSGAFVELAFAGKTLSTCRIRVFGSNGTEVATSGAYPAGFPTSLAASNLQITISGAEGAF
jgi:hypothetical protein